MAAESKMEMQSGPDKSAIWASWPILRLAPGLLGFLFILVLAQHVGIQHENEAEWPLKLCLGWAVALGLGLFMLWRSRRTLLTTLASVPFAVLLVFAVAGATALGTFVLQNAAEDAHSEWVNRLFLGDVFHSLWFGGLLALLALALILAVVKRSFWRLRHWGFVLTHGGMVAVIIGGAIGNFGERGMLELHKGQTSNKFSPEDALNAPAVQRLPFSVKLLNFEAQNHPDQLRFVVLWENPVNPDETKMLQTVPKNKAGEWTRLVGSALSFRVREEQGGTSASAPLPPFEVKIGQTYTLPGSPRTFRVAEFFPDFFYDIENKRGGSRGDKPNNPALRVEEPGVGEGGGDLTVFLFAHNPGHGQKEGALPLTYKYEVTPQGPQHLITIKSSDEPHATVEIKDKDGGIREVVLFAAGDGDRFCELPNNRRLFFENKKGDPKCYRSTVAIINEGKVVKEAVIEVNSPLSCQGYSLYQTSMTSEYSGLQVVKDPGLWVVYLGMVMISLGVAYVYYLRPQKGAES
jgi:hypothetical protein